jgi:hypothetical protein
MVFTLPENMAAGDEASSPFVKIRSVLTTVGIDIFLRNALDHSANSGPNSGSGAHRARLVRRIENKIGEITAVTAGYILERFEFYVLDAGARSFYAVTGIGNDNFALAHKSSDDGADWIVATFTSAFGFRDGQFHEFFSRLVRGRDHVARVYRFV